MQSDKKTDSISLSLRAKLLVASSTAITSLLCSTVVVAQEDEAFVEEVTVTGIRSSLANALDIRQNSDNLIEVIVSEDIGKLPDQNLAEVLENVTGIQITRRAGVGTGVQIRGSNSNRVEINGVSSVGAGSGRNGISFEDINPAIIASVEVAKASEAKTIEGSVGGTVNLKTIRPLDLKDTLINVRVQAEESSLSTEGMTPRLSGAFGKTWETNAGEFGVVVTGSLTETEAVSFRPRADRDNLSSAPGAAFTDYQGIQFLVQEQENDDYETLNLATTLEWAPNDDLRFYTDIIINNQERSQDSYRLEASGISGLRNRAENAPTAFETLDYSAVGGPILQGALAGIIDPNATDHDGNLRLGSETNSRVTDTQLISIGGEWNRDNWTVGSELAVSSSDSVTPQLNVKNNFINPGCPTSVAVTGRNDNCVPFIYDLSGDSLAFGINFDSASAPAPGDLLDPSNYVLEQVEYGANETENEESGFRIDVNYDFTDSKFGDFLTSVDAGIRLNKSTHKFSDFDDKIGGFSNLIDAPNASLFADILVAGPSNYGDADGRNLFIQDFLLVNPDVAFSNPDVIINSIESALAAHRVLNPTATRTDLTLDLEFDENSFRDLEEDTTAIYAQANFESGIFRGNLGLRYIDTSIDSTGYNSGALFTESGSYDFVLPRFNLVATPSDDVILRLAYGKDIRRPDFDDLRVGFTFDDSENAAVGLGNPGLEPEKVTSFDLSADWNFAPSAVVSVGYFSKDRTNIFGQDFEGALLVDDVNDLNGQNGTTDLVRETDPACPGGGIFNPEVEPNVLGDPNTFGLCADFTQPGNDPATTTQSGWELAAQYDLSEFEDRLGWASGFGFLANYTKQKFESGSVVDSTSGRGFTVLGDDSIPRGLLDFPKNAYNLTAYYEKYGLAARMRYTWREGFRTNDFAGGANTSGSSTLSFPVHTLDRGQLNASINYDITDQWNVGLEAVNLTEKKIVQKCVTEKGPTCFVGYPDRRIVLGVSYSY